MAIISVRNRADNFSNRISTSRFTLGKSRYDENTRATLYIFSPRQVPDVVVRSFVYDFTPEFSDEINTLVENTTLPTNGLTGFNYRAAFKMPNSRFANKAIAPDAYGSRFAGSVFDQLPTWFLVLDNVPFEGRYNPVGLQNRLLYAGVFLDDPVVERPGGRLVFNEGAQAIPTHMTHLNVKNIYSPSGSILKVSPMRDIDIIHPEMTIQSSPERKYLVRPDDLVDGLTFDTEDIQYYTPERSCLENFSAPTEVSTLLNNPREQLSTIVSGLAESVKSRNTIDKLPIGMDVRMDDDFQFYNAFKQNLPKDTQPDRFIGLRINEGILLGDLIKKYPMLKDNTQVFHLPWKLPDDPMDGSSPNAINIWSSLLMSTVPAVMSSFGISDAMFRYDSVDQSSYSMYDNHPVYELWELETFVPEESDNDIKTRWELALKHLEDYIFPIIIEQVGNFSAMIKYSSTKECGVQLNLLDATDEINNGIIMSNSLFGGFQSPLVASEELKNKNTQELSGVVQYVNASTTANRINNIY